MKRTIPVLLLAMLPCAAAGEAPARLGGEVQTLAGGTLDLASLRGKAVLVVNTASRCGYTPQYAGLQQLYERYRGRGMVVVGFPSNDFGGQEPGTAEEIEHCVACLAAGAAADITGAVLCVDGGLAM